MRGETSSAAERKSGVEGKVEVRGNSAGARIRTVVFIHEKYNVTLVRG